jgi:hypothetical protein
VSSGRIAGLWLLLAVLMSANGAFRELVLKRAVTPPSADATSAVLGMAIILAVTAQFLRPLADQPLAAAARVSVLLVVPTIAFEFLFGHYVDGKGWGELAGNYAIWRGRLWPVVLLTIATAPFLWSRRGS